MAQDMSDLQRLFRYVNALANDVELSLTRSSESINNPTDSNDHNLHDISEKINLKVYGLDNSIIQFRTSPHLPLGRLMSKYAELTGIGKNVARFRFDGISVHEKDTPNSLEMEEGDIIEVYYQQIGGGDEKILGCSLSPPLEDWRNGSTIQKMERLASLGIQASNACRCHKEDVPFGDFEAVHWQMRKG